MGNRKGLLDVSGLNVRYGAMHAVEDADLRLTAGDITVLLGANGAGKSSTLKAIAGSVRPTSGTIVLSGRELQGRSPDVMTREGVVLVPEGRRVFDDLTVDENLRLGAVTARNRKSMARQRELGLTLFPDLSVRLKQLAGTLSGGQQQMLAIARGLMSDPSLLLLDEPSLGVSPKLTFEIYTALSQLREQGKTILLVEQNAALALDIASTGYVMKNGSVVLTGSAEELKDSKEVRAAYLGGE